MQDDRTPGEQLSEAGEQLTAAYGMAVTVFSLYKGWQAGKHVLHTTGDRAMARSVTRRTGIGWVFTLWGVPCTLICLGLMLWLPFMAGFFIVLLIPSLIMLAGGIRLLYTARERAETTVRAFNTPPPIPGVEAIEISTSDYHRPWWGWLYMLK